MANGTAMFVPEELGAPPAPDKVHCEFDNVALLPGATDPASRAVAASFIK
jgi:hypothetical protein